MTTATKPSRLPQLFAALLARAQTTGDDRSTDLPGGARLAVRCVDGVVTLTISRRTKPLGATEIVTFCRDLVPEGALRWPQDGSQKVVERFDGVWHCVAFRWALGGEEQ
jgi:hypothetical protein